MIGTTILFMTTATILTVFMVKNDELYVLPRPFLDGLKSSFANMRRIPDSYSVPDSHSVPDSYAVSESYAISDSYSVSDSYILPDASILPSRYRMDLGPHRSTVVAGEGLVSTPNITEATPALEPKICILGVSCSLLTYLAFLFTVALLTFQLKHRFIEKAIRKMTMKGSSCATIRPAMRLDNEASKSASEIWLDSDSSDDQSGYTTFQPLADESLPENAVSLVAKCTESTDSSSVDKFLVTESIKPLDIVRNEQPLPALSVKAGTNSDETRTAHSFNIEKLEISWSLDSILSETRMLICRLSSFEWSKYDQISDQELTDYASEVTDSLLKGLDFMEDIETLFTKELGGVLRLHRDSIREEKRRSEFFNFNAAVKYHFNSCETRVDDYRSQAVMQQEDEELKILFKDILEVWQSPKVVYDDVRPMIPYDLQNIKAVERRISGFSNKWKKEFRCYLNSTPQQIDLEVRELNAMLRSLTHKLPDDEYGQLRQYLRKSLTSLTQRLPRLQQFYINIGEEIRLLVTAKDAVCSTLMRHIKQIKAIKIDIPFHPKMVNLPALQIWCERVNIQLNEQGKIVVPQHRQAYLGKY